MYVCTRSSTLLTLLMSTKVGSYDRTHENIQNTYNRKITNVTVEDRNTKL